MVELTVTILSYFREVHGLNLSNSNAFSLLESLRCFEQKHLAHESEFKTFRGLNFESILECVVQDIHRLEQSHKIYIDNGNIITANTKQYTIDQKNIEYRNSNLVIEFNKNNIKEAINEVFNPPQRGDTSSSGTVSRMQQKNNKKQLRKK